jgi:hypothetical protein
VAEEKKRKRERGARVGQAAWANVAKWPCSPPHDREDRLEAVVLTTPRRDASGRTGTRRDGAGDSPGGRRGSPATAGGAAAG